MFYLSIADSFCQYWYHQQSLLVVIRAIFLERLLQLCEDWSSRPLKYLFHSNHSIQFDPFELLHYLVRLECQQFRIMVLKFVKYFCILTFLITVY